MFITSLVRGPSYRQPTLRGGLAGLMALAVAMLASPVRAEAPSAYMQRVANELLAATRAGPAAQIQLASVIRRHADVPSIGMYSLGSYANGLSKQERPGYYSGMVNFVARYAAKESGKYPVTKAMMLSQTQEDSNGVYVDSRIFLKGGDTYDVRWWLVRRGTAYKVRDAQVIGFWMTPFLKNLFEKYIAENGGNPRALVVALNR